MTANNPDSSNNITSPGFRAKEAAADKRRQANIVSPDVRAARAAILAENDVKAQATREAETRAAQRPVEVFREILAFATDVQLEELHRSVGRIDSRSQQAAVGEIIATRARARYAADIAASSSSAVPASAAATIPVEAPESPARGRGRPKATQAA